MKGRRANPHELARQDARRKHKHELQVYPQCVKSLPDEKVQKRRRQPSKDKCKPLPPDDPRSIAHPRHREALRAFWFALADQWAREIIEQKDKGKK
jgi:hypothetical protein